VTLLIFFAAVLYASVGHAGASGYLAAMALYGVPAEVMKPTALCLNILVSTVVTLRFLRVGMLPWRRVLPFVLGSVPMAWLGGALHVPGHWYRPLVGVILLYSAARMAWPMKVAVAEPQRLPGRAHAAAWGSAIGLLSGLTGTGGGIFLSPLLILRGWADVRTASGMAAGFILVNSLAGLAGNLASVGHVPADAAPWGVAALVGGAIGSWLGTRGLAPAVLRRLLSAVLVVAGLKMAWT